MIQSYVGICAIAGTYRESTGTGIDSAGGDNIGTATQGPEGSCAGGSDRTDIQVAGLGDHRVSGPRTTGIACYGSDININRIASAIEVDRGRGATGL